MIHKLIDLLMAGFRELGADCACAEVERLAIMIHRIMSYRSRRFHTLEHVFGFLEGADALTAFAAAFHDLVYSQVDAGLPPQVESLVGPFILREEGGIRLAPPRPGEALGLRLSRAIFGFSPGRSLGLGEGLNEYLSALAMVSLLEGLLKPRELAAIAVCIEASIPFRGPDAEGRGVGEVLEARLAALDASGELPLPEAERIAMVRRAIAFSNEDVRDFAAEDPGRFLSNTWKLLPESNAALRSGGTFSIREYRRALERMDAFFRSLKPEAIYHDYRGQPGEAAMASLREAARRNLGYAGAYLKAKLLAVGLLEAAAELSGGDAPMALFMGDVPREGESEESLMSYLPEIAAPPWIDRGNAVYRLLKDGRLDESSFDLRNSPLALYLYHRLRPGEWRERGEALEAFFAGRLEAETFLRGFEGGFLREFLSALGAMVPTRSRSIEAWLRAEPSPHNPLL